MKTMTALLMALIALQTAQAQLLWVENFNYPVGALPTTPASDWVEYEGGNAVQVVSDDMQYSGYPASGGKSITISNAGGQDVFRTFGSAQTSSVYVSFLVKVTAAPTGSDGGNFFYLDETNGDNTPFALLRVRDLGNDSLKFGITKGGNLTIETPAFTSKSFAKSDIHLIVLKYEINNGPANDTVRLWVNPVLSGGEPTEDVKVGHIGVDDASELWAVAIIQQSTGGVSANIDGIRAGKNWDNAPLPVQLASFAAFPIRAGAEIRWSTATEVDNYGFEIERKIVRRITDARPYDARSESARLDWEKVGFVGGAGTSTSPQEYSFVDKNLLPGRYAYRLKQIDTDGSYSYSYSTEVEVGLAVRALMLLPSYPNPFNPTTNIEFIIPENGFVELQVFNVLGQEVAVLYRGEAEGGRAYVVSFDASSLPTGMYVSRLTLGNRSITQKMILAR